MATATAIRAVIFDLDGTLVDTEPMHFEGMRRVLAPEGIEVDREDYYRRLIHFTDRECFALILGQHARPATPAQVEELVARKAARYLELLDGAELPYPAAREFVMSCARRFALALATGTLRTEADMILTRLGWRELFAVIVAAEDVARGKPEPEPFLLALARLNSQRAPAALIAPSQCLVVEDTPAGIEAARRAGMRVLAVAQTVSADALAAADIVRPSLSHTDLDEVLARLAR